MSRRLLGYAACALIAGGCTTGSDAGASASTTEPAPVTTSATSLTGRLAVVDPSGNIHNIDPEGAGQVQVTDDAGESVGYAQPAWSPGSDRLAWVELRSTGVGVALGEADGSGRSSTPMAAPPFYLYWSPDGGAIGALHNGATGVELELVDTSDGTSMVVASGTPLYFSWSPDSDRLVAHIEQGSLVTIDLGGATDDVGPTVGAYAAPHWIDGGIVHVGGDGIEVRRPDGTQELLAEIRGPLAMVADSRGDRLAVQSYADEESGISAAVSPVPLLPANSVVVLDLSTGEVSQVSDALSVGFFWSPDGEKLLVLEPSGEPGEVEVLVWDGADTETQFQLAPHPTFVRDVLQFFDQYSQSLQLWAPDSSAFSLAGAVDGEPGIWVHTLGAGGPVKVFEGTWVTWSS